jgi:hypothetical protein
MVEIYNAKGSVRVVGWDREEIAITGTLGSGVERLDVSGDAHRTAIRVVIPEGEQPDGANVEQPQLSEAHLADVGPSHIEVRVPEQSQVEVASTSADVEVSRTMGRLYIQSIAGSIVVTDRPKEVEVGSVCGEIRISTSNSRAKVSSVKGPVLLKSTSGEADVASVSGEILIQGGRYDRGRFKSISGDIRFGGTLNPGGAFEFSNHSGDVELVLPWGIKADFRVSSYSGTIENAFGPAPDARASNGHIKGRKLSFSTGPGEIEAESARVPKQPFPGRRPGKGPGRGRGAYLEEEALLPSVLSQRAYITVETFKGNVRLRRK